jgi:HK97 family phage major capsid protein
MEIKEQFDALQSNVNEFRSKLELMEKGQMSKADFKTFEDKIWPDIQSLKSAVNKPATVVSPDNSEVKNVDGQREYRKALFEHLRTGIPIQLNEKARAYYHERKALVADTTGQILITEELESEIYRGLPQLNIVRSLSTVRGINTDKIRRRSMTEVTMGWGKLELGGTPPESDTVPTEDYSYVEDMSGLTKVGEDELSDSDVAIEAILGDSFSRARANLEEAAFINGTGHSFQQPEGILLTASGVTCVDTAASGAVTFDDMMDLKYAVPPQYRNNADFLMHSDTEKYIAKLRETATGGYGAYLWQPAVALGQPATILGRPVHNCVSMPALSDGTLQKVVIFGDFKAGYRILDRKGMTVKRLVELWALAGLIGLLVGSRVGGSVVRPDAFRILQEHS